jgi:hypothetical protein
VNVANVRLIDRQQRIIVRPSLRKMRDLCIDKLERSKSGIAAFYGKATR